MKDGFPWPEAELVGSWWNRQFSPETDLIGADRAPVAQSVHFAGSVKMEWLGTPFDQHDLTALRQAAAQVPGFQPASTGLVVVGLSGITGVEQGAVGLVRGPSDIVSGRPARLSRRSSQSAVLQRLLAVRSLALDRRTQHT